MTTPMASTQLNTQTSTSNQAQTTRNQSCADQVVAEEKSTGKAQTLATNLKSWSKVVGDAPIVEGFDLEGEINPTVNVKITIEDVKEEIEYW